MSQLENRMVIDSEWSWQERTPVMECDFCPNEISKGDHYYNVTGDIVCEDCISEYMEENFGREA